MATSTLPILLLLVFLLAATASARPCKILFYFTATTTTTYYPYNSLNRNPNPNSILHTQKPRYFTLIFTTSTTKARFRDLRPSLNFDSNNLLEEENSQSSPSMMTSSDSPIKFYSSVSSSARDRTRDIMSVVGALLFGVGCGALTGAAMYLVWALFTQRRLDFDDVSSSSSDDDDDDVAAAKKLGYVTIPAKPKLVDDDLKKPASPAKEVV